MIKKYVAIYLTQDREGRPCAKPASIEKFSPEAERKLQVPGRFGRVFELEANDKDGKITAKKHEEEIIKEFSEKYLKHISSTKTEDGSINPDDMTPPVQNEAKEAEENEQGENTSKDSSENKPQDLRIAYKYAGGNSRGVKIQSLTADIQTAINERKAIVYIFGEKTDEEVLSELSKLDPFTDEKHAKRQLGLLPVSSEKKEDKNNTFKPTYQVPGGNTEKKPQNVPPASHQYSSPSNSDFIQLKNEIRTLSTKIDNIERNIKTNTKENVQTAADFTRQRISNDVKGIVAEAVSDLATKKKLDNLLEDISDSMDGIKSNVQESAPALETIQGKLTVIEDLFSKKGVSIQKDVVPTNTDSKVIANAQKLAKRLLDDITSAALEYANNREIIENAAANEERIRIEAGDQIEKSKLAAKVDLIKEILGAYENVEGFVINKNNSIIVSVMKKYGLTEDEKFKSGNKVMVNSSEINELLTKVKGIENEGTYFVKQSMFLVGEDIISKAIVEKATE